MWQWVLWECSSQQRKDESQAQSCADVLTKHRKTLITMVKLKQQVAGRKAEMWNAVLAKQEHGSLSGCGQHTLICPVAKNIHVSMFTLAKESS